MYKCHGISGIKGDLESPLLNTEFISSSVSKTEELIEVS